MRGLPPVVLGVLLLAQGALPDPAAAQDWGLTRDRRPPPRHRAEPRRSRSRGRSAAGKPRPASGRSRVDTLIARYTGILERDPRESFAFERLLDLYRERDGNIEALLSTLEGRRDGDPKDFAARMLVGHIYRAQGRGADARAAYESAGAIRDGDPRPVVAMARIDRASGDLGTARRLYDRALELTGAEAEKRELTREAGQVALDQNDWDGARAYYERLSRGARGSVYLKTELARALSERGEHARAVEEYRRVLGSLRGDNRVLPPVLRDLARAELEAGDPEAAIETLERALRLARKQAGIRAELYDVLVEAYRAGNRLPELAQRLERGGPRSVAELELVGRIHDELGNEEEALSAYRRVLKKKPRNIDTRLRVVQLLSRSGRIDEVIAEYRSLIRTAPREPRFVVELAQLLMQVGRRDEALRLAADTSRRYPREPSVHQALAQLYARWGEDERATEEVRRLVRIDPRDPSHLIALGSQQLAEGRTADALATWRRILTVTPDRADAYAKLASVLADHDLLDEAEEAYREAVRREPDEVTYVRGLASVLERPRGTRVARGSRDAETEAAEHWMRVLELAEDDRAARREARQHIVGIWARRRELPKRIVEWRARFFADPPDLEAGRFLAAAYMRERPRALDKAEEVLVAVVTKAPGDVESLMALERIRTTRGDLAGAIEVLEKLVEADPRKAPSHLQRMAEHALALYRDEDAVKYAEMAVQRTPEDAALHRRLGDLYRARQDMDRAVASYRRAIELNERLFPTYFDLAEIHLARGELSEADVLFRRVMRASPDDELVARAARAAIQIHMGQRSLPELERDLLPLALGHPRRPVFRKLVVELYDALSRPLIQAMLTRGVGEEEASAELRRIGTRALKPLLEALSDHDPAQRRVAIDILGHLGNVNAAAPLLAAAEAEGDLSLRARALLAAGAVAGSEHTARFAEIARGGERRLRGVAAWALARMGGRKAVAVMRALLTHADPTVRAMSALGLGRARDRASSEALVEMLREEKNVQVTACAAWALGHVGGPDHIDALVTALRSGEGLLSRAAAVALGTLGDPRAREALAQAVFDPDSALRGAGAAALARLAADAKPQEPVFFTPSGSTLSAAGYVSTLLAQEQSGGRGPLDVAPHRAVLVGAARDAFKGPVERVLTALSVLLGEGGVSFEETGRASILTELLDELEEAALHPTPAVREKVVRLLSAVGGPRAVTAIVSALDAHESSVQRAALSALEAVAGGVPEAGVLRVARMVEEHPDWSTRMRAAEALRALGQRSAIPALTRSLSRDPFAFVREAAATALGRIGGPEAAQALSRAASEDVEARVRRAAEKALQGLVRPTGGN